MVDTAEILTDGTALVMFYKRLEEQRLRVACGPRQEEDRLAVGARPRRPLLGRDRSAGCRLPLPEAIAAGHPDVSPSNGSRV